MLRDFISEIKELQTSNVYIKDKEKVNQTLEKLIEGGSKKLQVVSDFDRTITKQHEEGKIHLSSFGMFTQCSTIPREFLVREKELTGKYLPIELDPAVPHQEKRKHMEDWWSLTECALKGLKVSQSDIDDVVKTLGPSVRDGTKSLFEDLQEAGVPVLVFSAGLGDAVVSVLKYFDVLLPNVKVISNFLKYNDGGTIEGFKHKAIHLLNKNELALKGTGYYEVVRDRDNIIVLGDSLGDAQMADGVPKTNAILKIGFLYNHINNNLLEYMDTFDIVLEDDQTMHVLQAILKYIL